MCPEEVEIEDVSKIEINLWMDMKELEIRDIEDKSIAIDSEFIVFFGD